MEEEAPRHQSLPRSLSIERHCGRSASGCRMGRFLGKDEADLFQRTVGAAQVESLALEAGRLKPA